tara:strand:- start:587 stop:814 length:228 start_codon:yes stop_codon:yes gene_type:complete
MKIEMIDDDGTEVFFSAIEVWIGNQQKLAGAFKVGAPPGMIGGGEFVKDANGKTAFFNADKFAIDAAKELYESKK